MDKSRGSLLVDCTLERIDNTTFELPNKHILFLSELPAVEIVVCLVQVSKYEDIYLTYDDLGTWVEANNYELLTPHREVIIVPPLPLQREDAIVEIQLPLKLKTYGKSSL